MVLYFARKYDLAIQLLSNALEMDTGFVLANIPLGGAYIQRKMYPEAMKAFSQLTMATAFATSKAHPIPIAGLAYAYGISGQKDDALAMLELLEEKSKEEYVAPYWMSIVFVGLGDNEEAFKWLEKAYRERDGSMMFLNVEPLFDPLRRDLRFAVLLKKMAYL